MPATHDEKWQTAILRLTRALRPATTLCLGDEAAALMGETAFPVQSIDIDRLLDSAITGQRYDLAVVAGALEALEHRRGSALLARLRDIYARRLLVKATLASAPDRGWTNNDMLALGLREVLRQRAPRDEIGLYQFNLYDYKLTPDWFNARNWAHPHLWKP
jgi:Family of unknown function (DUF6231)